MTEEIKEIAKAASETAKFGTKALEVSEKLLIFFGKVFKELDCGRFIGVDEA